MDGTYLEKDWANDWGGFFQRMLSQAGIAPNGVVDTAQSSQYYDALISIIGGISRDYLNALTVNVASSANVDLTASAPLTANINITGSTTITGFTAAAGKCYIARFAGSLTLTNNANIVTPSGANIITSAGDSCLIRFTAANVANILMYTPGIPQEIGYRQSYASFIGSRTINTDFNNGTGRPIMLSVAINARAGDENFNIQVNGLTVAQNVNNGTSGEDIWLSAIIPAGATYRVNAFVGAVITVWTELR